MSTHVCPACRHTLPADQRFCGHCGADTTAAPAQPTALADATATSVPDESAGNVGLSTPERLGRGDRRTAVRFALAFAAVRFLWYLLAPHVAAPGEVAKFTSHLAWTMYRFGLAYVFYLAVEPYARRLWPRMLTSWVRLFDGRFRDPLVGRDVLIGLALAMALVVSQWSVVLLGERLGLRPFHPVISEWAIESLRGLPGALLGVAGELTSTTLDLFLFVMIIFLMRLVMRRDALTLIPLALLMGVFSFNDGPPVLAVIGSALFIFVIWFALFRVGLLTLAVTFLAASLFSDLPLTFDLTAWWAAPTWITLAVLLGVAVWSFRTALAGQPVFRERLFEG